MKVAFFTYPAAFQNVGGGEIVLLKMREFIQKKGVTVDLLDTWHSRIEDYHVLHVFGSVKDCLGMVRVANSRKVKVAITPIWWSDYRRAFFAEGSLQSKVSLVARHTTKILFPAFPSSRRELLRCADRVLPNSEMEKDQVARHFAIPMDKCRVVYNGVDAHFADADPSAFRKKIGADPFILGVGRIEPRKNQLNLIRAIKKLSGLKLVLIGDPVSGFESYYAACLTEGKDQVTFVPSIAHDDPLLKSAYAACDLFVLQGWFETPGLAAMEAALAGARLVVTSGGSTREYFQDKVGYIDPANVSDIADKIRIWLNKPRDPSLQQRMLDHFTWDRVASDTIRCYQDMCGV